MTILRHHHFVALCIVTAYAHPMLDVRQSAPSLPTGWTSSGCYSDVTSSRTLRIAAFTDVNNMTIESCIAFCTPAAYRYAGVEFSRECYCDNVIESPGAPIDDSNCNMPCTGNSAEICGGSNAINIFNNTAILPPPPPPPPATIKQNVGTFTYKGCFQDGVNGAPRSLPNQFTLSGGATAETCTAVCQQNGFHLAGLEFGGECWCASYMILATSTPDTDCNMVCNADDTELCGAGNRLAVYQDTSILLPNTEDCLNPSLFTPAGQAFTFNLFMVSSTTANSFSPVLLGAVFQGTFGPDGPIERAIFELSGDNSSVPEAHIFTLEANLLIPNDALPNVFSTLPVVPANGQSQIFLPDQDVESFATYCASPNILSPFGPLFGPPVLGINRQFLPWFSCTSTITSSADPLTPIFIPTSSTNSGNCLGVVLEMIPWPLIGL